jgi:hypothetical protein
VGFDELVRESEMGFRFPDAGYFQDKMVLGVLFLRDFFDERGIHKQLDVSIFDLIMDFELRHFVPYVGLHEQRFFYAFQMINQILVLSNRKRTFVLVVIFFDGNILKRDVYIDSIQDKETR